jgi:hypothetical protein
VDKFRDFIKVTADKFRDFAKVTADKAQDFETCDSFDLFDLMTY